MAVTRSALDIAYALFERDEPLVEAADENLVRFETALEADGPFPELFEERSLNGAYQLDRFIKPVVQFLISHSLNQIPLWRKSALSSILDVEGRLPGGREREKPFGSSAAMGSGNRKPVLF